MIKVDNIDVQQTLERFDENFSRADATIQAGQARIEKIFRELAAYLNEKKVFINIKDGDLSWDGDVNDFSFSYRGLPIASWTPLDSIAAEQHLNDLLFALGNILYNIEEQTK